MEEELSDMLRCVWKRNLYPFHLLGWVSHSIIASQFSSWSNEINASLVRLLVGLYKLLKWAPKHRTGLWNRRSLSSSLQCIEEKILLFRLEYGATVPHPFLLIMEFSSVQFSHSLLPDSLQPIELQHTRLPCTSSTPGAYSKSCPLSQWSHPTISSSVIPFSSCLQSFPLSVSFPMSLLFTSGGPSIGVSASTSHFQWIFRTDFL